MTITLTLEMEQAIQEEAARQNKTLEQLALEALITGLRNQKIPQTLDEIKPRSPLPPGKTLKDVFEEFWRDYPPEEDGTTDEEVNAALERLS